MAKQVEMTLRMVRQLVNDAVILAGAVALYVPVSSHPKLHDVADRVIRRFCEPLPKTKKRK